MTTAYAHRPVAQADGHPGTDTLLDMVARAIAVAVGDRGPAITADTLFEDDLRIDPLAFALVAAVIEDVFRVTLPDAVARDMRSVGDLVEWLDRQYAADRITS